MHEILRLRLADDSWGPFVYGGVKTHGDCGERSDVAIRSLSNANALLRERIAPAVRPVIPPGRYGAPAGALQPHGLQGNGLPHQRARWFAMTGLGVRWVWMGYRGSGGCPAYVMTPPGSCSFARQYRPNTPDPNHTPAGRGFSPFPAR